MGIDLFILCLTLFFALWGALSGASRQLAQALAVLVSYVVARPLGVALGPKMADLLGGAPKLFGTIAATMVTFVVLMVAIRYLFTQLFRRILSGKDPSNRTVDRALGFGIGAAKVLAIAYVMVSGLVFAEENISLAGRKLGLSPKDSIAFMFARDYNLFTYTEFAGVRQLVGLSKVLADPERARRLGSDPAYLALKKDPRFQKALSEQSVRKALESGDTQALLRSNAVLQLIQDPTALARMSAAIEKAERQ